MWRQPLIVLLLVIVAGIAYVSSRTASTRPSTEIVTAGTRDPPVVAPSVEADRDIAIDALVPDPLAFAAPAQATTPAPIDAVLLDDSVPLSERIAELDRRARRGEAAAGCQLGLELARCASERSMHGFHQDIDGQVQGMARRDGQSASQLRAQADFMLQRQARNERILAACEGIDPARWAAPARYLSLAAQRGHRPSMQLVLDASLYRTDTLYRDPGLIPMLRREGPRWFQQLVETGDPRMLDRVRNAAVGRGDFLYEILPAPWNSPDIANEILRQMHGPNRLYPQPRTALSTAQVAQATRLREQWFEPDREARAADSGRVSQAMSFGDAADFGCAELAR